MISRFVVVPALTLSFFSGLIGWLQPLLSLVVIEVEAYRCVLAIKARSVTHRSRFRWDCSGLTRSGQTVLSE